MKRMKGRHAAAALAISLLGFVSAGCAGGPSWTDVQDDVPGIPPGHGRIFFFRSGSFAGAAVRPDIRLTMLEDGRAVREERVGASVPGGSFFVDRPAGDYRVACKTEVERSATFRLEPGEVQYVRTSISLGFFVGHVNPGFVSAARGEKALASTSYTGPPLGPRRSGR